MVLRGDSGRVDLKPVYCRLTVHMQFVAKRPDPAEAHRELRRNIVLFMTVVAAARVAPYVLQLLQGESAA